MIVNVNRSGLVGNDRDVIFVKTSIGYSFIVLHFYLFIISIRPLRHIKICLLY